MSTTKIEAVLKAHMRDAHARRDREAVREAHEAMHELALLRKAAKAATTDPAFWTGGMMDPTEATLLLEQIAEETP